MSRPLVQRLRSHVVIYVWFRLIAATLLSYWLGAEPSLGSILVRSILILIVAIIKVRFVGMYFMELWTAPLPLRAYTKLGVLQYVSR
jgi:Prokaryotic Cytochrome C oxidase subunit IV